MPEATIRIRKGREKPIRNQHPWVFSGAIDTAQNAQPGDIVTVRDERERFLARGYYNPRSQIQVRLLTWQDEAVDEAWWQRKLKQAIEHRYSAPRPNVANRIVNAENDFLPGLIVDRYSDFLVLQALTLHIDQQKDTLAAMLVDLFAEAQMPIRGVYERSDVDVRGKEGLRPTTGVLWGAEPPEHIACKNDGLTRLVDVRQGHKTGYYLDQLQNQRLTVHLAPDGVQLNTFAYTGGFGLSHTGRTINVDASYEALELAEHTFAANDFSADRTEFIQADVFDYLRDCVERDAQFDTVILDPPKFANNKQQVQSAARGYKDINLNAFKLVKPGGYLITFSCSGAVNRDLFQKIVFGALADSGRQAQILRHLGAADDHPIALTFPEGDYLKGLLLRVS